MKHNLVNKDKTLTEMPTLYCFRFDEVLCTIQRLDIVQYQKVYLNEYGKFIYKWTTPQINNSDKSFRVTPNKIDRFVNNKVYTFNPDKEYALKIILDTLRKKQNKANLECKRCEFLIHKIWEVHNG